MSYKYTFITSQTLNRIDRKVRAIEKAHPDAIQHWQLWQMVATIEAGKAEALDYEGNGLNMRWWSVPGNPDPSTAHQGFYRQEKGQMAGWSLWLVWQKPPSERADEFQRLMHNIYRFYDLRWEDEPMVWGWRALRDFYTEDEAQTVATDLKREHGNRLRSLLVDYSEMSGCWRVTAESTKKLHWNWEQKLRIPMKRMVQ